MNRTSISYVDYSLNLTTGCTQGCAYCYARRWAGRGMGEWQGRPFEEVRTHPERMEARAPKRRRSREGGHNAGPLVLVETMGDLFDPLVPEGFLLDVFRWMRETPWRTYLVLTKRVERMAACCQEHVDLMADNVVWGTTVTGPGDAWRAERLTQIPGRRWLSLEPLIKGSGEWDLGEGVEFVAVGGATGPGPACRFPVHPGWVRRIRNGCRQRGVVFHFKGWGNWRPVCGVYPMESSGRYDVIDRTETDLVEEGPEAAEARYGGLDAIVMDEAGRIWMWEERGRMLQFGGQPPLGSWLFVRRPKAGRVLDGNEYLERVQGADQ